MIVFHRDLEREREKSISKPQEFGIEREQVKGGIYSFLPNSFLLIIEDCLSLSRNVTCRIMNAMPLVYIHEIALYTINIYLKSDLLWK